VTVVVASPGRALGRVGRRMRDWVPALLVFVLGIVVWEGAIAVFDIEQFLLPRPTDIVQTLYDQRGTLWGAGWYTFREALGGFVIGSGAAILFAILVSRFASLGRALMPIAIAANAVPIIAFAPIFNAWFDPLAATSKMAVAAVLCFSP